MKFTTAILVCLLLFGPAYGREHKHSVQTAGALHAALTASETEGTETDDQEMNNDNNDTDTDDRDTGETTDTDDQDNHDTNMNDDNDNETDDMDDDVSSVKTAIRNILKASALKNSQKPFAAAAAALDAGLNAQQTITQLLEPAGSGSSAAASVALLQSAGGGSAAVENGALVVTNNAAVAASGSSSAGQLSVTAVPEPTTCFLLAMGALPWFWIRRRP